MKTTYYHSTMERELAHHRILVRIFETVDIYQDAYFFIDEVEPDLYEAETKMPLYIEARDLVCDIQVAMAENGIKGKLVNQIDFIQAPKHFTV